MKATPTTAFPLAVVFALLLAGCTASTPPAQKQFTISSNGLLELPQDRGPVAATEALLERGDNYSVYKIAFTSADGARVYGLLDVPTANGRPVQNAPAAVFMPGLGVAKEGGNMGVGKALAQAGFVVFVLDQRGVGETGGNQMPLEADYAAFATGNYSQQHLMVYDYLRAFDYLAARPEVDAGRVIFAGESHGGRVAIMAAGLEPRAKGVLAISTAGYDFVSPPAGAQSYLASVNPDSYIGRLAPRGLLMMHSQNDRGVPIAQARRTFSHAGQPREFIEIPCEYHGYCTQIAGLVAQKAREIVSG